MDTWKISANSDSAVQDALSDFIVEVNMTLPAVKTNYFELYGINGSIDETEALGDVNYNDREVTLFLITKTGINNPKSAVDSFINTYVGSKIRLHNTTQGYMLIGRITDVEQTKTKADESYKLTCTVVCDPLRYETSYTPSASGLDLRPTAWSENIWNTTNVSGSTGATVTATGGTIAPNTQESYAYVISLAALPSGKLTRIYLQSLTNCTIEIQRGERTIGNGSGSHIYLSTGTPVFYIIVRPIDVAQTASFGCIVRTIDTSTITTDGKSVPIQINSTYEPNVNYPVKMFINGTVFTVKPNEYGETWREYAPAMLKTGANDIAAFVDTSTFDPDASHGVLNIRYRAGRL